MKITVLKGCSLFTMTLLAGATLFAAQDQAGNPETTFYENSLHYTNKGLEYWYSKDHGGLERITGIPFSQLSCNGCHVRTCDACHVATVDGKPSYSADTARTEAACAKCHSTESMVFARKNPGDSTADVHCARGMKCVDCHTAREVHGDGTAYDSMQAKGVMDTRCEKCHADLSKCPSNAVHKGKLDCSACHVRDVQSCYNCHFDTKISTGKSVSLPLKNMLFLINHDDKVTLGNLHTFVYRDKTMIVFAPAFSHLIMKEGRRCGDCHGSQLVREMGSGSFRPVVWEEAGLRNARGVIPVLEGFDWKFVFLNYADGKWSTIARPAKPLLNYSGYSSPLTKEQFARLAAPQGRRSAPAGR